MSTNRWLSERTATALRAEAASSGRSEDELLREAVARYLGLEKPLSSRERAIAEGLVKASTPMKDVEPWIHLSPGMTTLNLLGRDGDR